MKQKRPDRQPRQDNHAKFRSPNWRLNDKFSCQGEKASRIGDCIGYNFEPCIPVLNDKQQRVHQRLGTFLIWYDIGLITSCCSGKEHALLPQTHGWTHFLVSANHLTARRFLSGINLSVCIAAHDGGWYGVDKWHAKELQRQLRSKLYKFLTRYNRKVGRWPRCVSLFSKQGQENLNLLHPEHNQLTKTKHWAQETKHNSQSNRCITFFKDSNSSLWWSQAKLFKKKTSEIMGKAEGVMWNCPACDQMTFAATRSATQIKLWIYVTDMVFRPCVQPSLFGEERRPNTKERQHLSLSKTWL